jgi:uncharacterized membrane protein
MIFIFFILSLLAIPVLLVFTVWALFLGAVIGDVTLKSLSKAERKKEK